MSVIEGPFPECDCNDCDEAREKLAKAEARIKQWENEEESAGHKCWQMEERAKAAEAKVARLREALIWLSEDGQITALMPNRIAELVAEALK